MHVLARSSLSPVECLSPCLPYPVLLTFAVSSLASPCTHARSSLLHGCEVGLLPSLLSPLYYGLFFCPRAPPLPRWPTDTKHWATFSYCVEFIYTVHWWNIFFTLFLMVSTSLPGPLPCLTITDHPSRFPLALDTGCMVIFNFFLRLPMVWLPSLSLC